MKATQDVTRWQSEARLQHHGCSGALVGAFKAASGPEHRPVSSRFEPLHQLPKHIQRCCLFHLCVAGGIIWWSFSETGAKLTITSGKKRAQSQDNESRALIFASDVEEQPQTDLANMET